MKKKRLTTSISMLHLCASNYADSEGKQADGQRNPSQSNDDSNNCEVILENVLYTDSD